MAGTVDIWHNPRCSKSRETLALLTARGLEPQVRLYLKDPPSEADIFAVQKALGVPPIDMMRKGEKLFKELGLADADDDTLTAAMADHPILIERPLVLHDGKAALGRPPAAVLDIL